MAAAAVDTFRAPPLAAGLSQPLTMESGVAQAGADLIAPTSCKDGSAPAEATPEQAAAPQAKCHIWPGHDGWTYRRGSGLVDWIYTSPHGDEYESEAEALFVASSTVPAWW